MEFYRACTVQPKFGHQCKAGRAAELNLHQRQPWKNSSAPLCSRGCPKTARKIVGPCRSELLEIFAYELERLIEVPGMADKRLLSSISARLEQLAYLMWFFLQASAISCLFAVRIHNQYQEKAIAMLAGNSYRLAVVFFRDRLFRRRSAGLVHWFCRRLIAAHYYRQRASVVGQSGTTGNPWLRVHRVLAKVVHCSTGSGGQGSWPLACGAGTAGCTAAVHLL